MQTFEPCIHKMSIRKKMSDQSKLNRTPLTPPSKKPMSSSRVGGGVCVCGGGGGGGRESFLITYNCLFVCPRAKLENKILDQGIFSYRMGYLQV